tara:strand:+ start:1540 stop:2220 length:681 start_codon:yes stop_codon:yes gene_type:complete
MHYFSFHIGDYRSSTAHLNNDEDLCYRRLIEMYYDTEKPIPVDVDWVSRRVRMHTEVVDRVLSDFFTAGDDGWRHSRCDLELENYQGLVERNRKNGSKGGRPPNNPAGSQPKPTGKVTKNQEPLTNNHKPVLKNKALPCPGSVSQQVWDDFCFQRKKLKAEITQTGLAGIAKEAAKVGWTLEAALTECTIRGWRGFKADWVSKTGRGSNDTKDFKSVNYGEGVQDI